MPLSLHVPLAPKMSDFFICSWSALFGWMCLHSFGKKKCVFFRSYAGRNSVFQRVKQPQGPLRCSTSSSCGMHSAKLWTIRYAEPLWGYGYVNHLTDSFPTYTEGLVSPGKNSNRCCNWKKLLLERINNRKGLKWIGNPNTCLKFHH